MGRLVFALPLLIALVGCGQVGAAATATQTGPGPVENVARRWHSMPIPLNAAKADGTAITDAGNQLELSFAGNPPVIYDWFKFSWRYSGYSFAKIAVVSDTKLGGGFCPTCLTGDLKQLANVDNWVKTTDQPMLGTYAFGRFFLGIRPEPNKEGWVYVIIVDREAR